MPSGTSILLQACKLSAILLLLLPSLFFSLIFLFFLSFFFFLPIICILTSTFVFIAALSRIPIISVTKHFLIYVLVYDDPLNHVDVPIENVPECVELDCLEVPFDNESEEEEEEEEKWEDREEDFSNFGEETMEDLLEIQTLKPIRCGEDYKFSKLLSFWRRKERDRDVVKFLQIGRGRKRRECS
ncbi:uncharacterized protein LOC143856785 [Tasmannia lanceolata]|uniref:uncharacterized protein LOC143856785 n=1 Tax=Tasmannia lanceolata TaxID=3420 RepID=UPI004063D3D3